MINSSVSQVYDPVSWEYGVEYKGNDITLLLSATIDKGWHMYAQDLPSDEGPLPTVFEFEESTKYIRSGKTIEPKPHEYFDPNFQVNSAYFEDKVTFRQKIELIGKSNKFDVKGLVSFMVCNDEMCLPPEDVEFSIKIDTEKKDQGNLKIKEENIHELPQDHPTTTAATAKPFTKAPVEKKNDNSNQSDSEGILDPVKWKYKVVPTEDSNVFEVKYYVTIEEGWHIYGFNLSPDATGIPTSITFDTVNYELLGDMERPDPVSKEDKAGGGGIVPFYEGEVTFTQKVKVKHQQADLKFELGFLSCDDEKCLAPVFDEISLAIPGRVVDLGGEKKSLHSVVPKIENLDLDNPKSDCTASKQVETSSIWGIFFLAFGIGLLALLTPCIWPMIPITVSFFLKGSEKKSKGIINALIYGACIFLIYASISLPFHIANLDGEVLEPNFNRTSIKSFLFCLVCFLRIFLFGIL